MLYKLDFTPLSPVATMPITGAMIDPTQVVQFVPWVPSAWPDAPQDDHHFVAVLKRIYELSMLLEIAGVIDDANAQQGSLDHRGHVIAISLFCALDAISSYGYGALSGKQIPPFVEAHFPQVYQAHARALLYAYRHAMIHSWNLFGAAILPGREDISERSGTVSFGLIAMFEALKYATEHFLEQLHQKPALMANARLRYTQLQQSAR